jgi:hypothetical protein
MRRNLVDGCVGMVYQNFTKYLRKENEVKESVFTNIYSQLHDVLEKPCQDSLMEILVEIDTWR